jgi:tetratricopeptide (TPR) repeat protein
VGQLFYYFLLFGLVSRYLGEYPWLLGGALVLYLLKDRLPDPYVYLRTAGRIRRLAIEVAQNPDNATARRDLALVWLSRSRPRRAIPLLTEARRRDPESAELNYLLGLALSRAGRHEEALPLFVEAHGRDPRLRYGEVYLSAAVALTALGQKEEAEDALLMHLKINGSSVEGWVRLARLRRTQGDAAGARAALSGAVEAFEQSPRFQRRRQLAWYLRAQLQRAF